MQGGRLWYACTFQSSPSPGAGRCSAFTAYGYAVQRVSILAQPGGRALRK